MMKGVRLRGAKKEIRDGNSFLIPPSAYYIQYIDMWSANKGNKLLTKETNSLILACLACRSACLVCRSTCLVCRSACLWLLHLSAWLALVMPAPHDIP
jgi:hypothetical protein